MKHVLIIGSKGIAASYGGFRTCYNMSDHHVSGLEFNNKIEYDGIRLKFVLTTKKGLAMVTSFFLNNP